MGGGPPLPYQNGPLAIICGRRLNGEVMKIGRAGSAEWVTDFGRPGRVPLCGARVLWGLVREKRLQRSPAAVV
jgi:hypothetical protein